MQLREKTFPNGLDSGQAAGNFPEAELHALLLALPTTFREKTEWLEEAEPLDRRPRAVREQAAKGSPADP